MTSSVLWNQNRKATEIVGIFSMNKQNKPGADDEFYATMTFIGFRFAAGSAVLLLFFFFVDWEVKRTQQSQLLCINEQTKQSKFRIFQMEYRQMLTVESFY